MSRGKAVAGVAAAGALGLGLYIFRDPIMFAINGLVSNVTGAPPPQRNPAPASTGLNHYFDNVSYPPNGGMYLVLDIKEQYGSTGLAPADFPSNSGVWIDDEFIGYLSEAAYEAANPGYRMGKAILVPVKFKNTGKHVITYSIPGVGVQKIVEWF